MDLNYAISEKFPPSLSSAYGKDNTKDGKSYVYKKTSYQYSSSGNNMLYKSEDRNMDQLDELLQDLKHEREHTKDFDLSPSSVSYRTNEYERSEPIGTGTNTMRTIKTSSPSIMNQSAIESNITSTDHSTVTLSGNLSRQGTPKRGAFEINEYKNGPGKIHPQNVYDTKHKNYQSVSRFEHGQPLPPNDSVTFSENLEDIPLTENILPPPGVKVTTTVRTYTYEIPADSTIDRSGTRTLLYRNSTNINNNNNVEPSDGNRMLHSPPATIFYNTESYSTVKNTDGSPIVTNRTTELNDQVDIIKRKDMHTSNSHLPDLDPNNSNKTYIYKLEKSQNFQSASETVYNPIRNPNYEMESNPNKHYNQEPSKTPHYTNNNKREPLRTTISPTRIEPPLDYPTERTSLNPPINTSSVSYKYISQTNNTNNLIDQKPNAYMQPAPFPIDGGNFSNGNPPQRVDDLMHSFNSDTLDRSDIETLPRKREIETAVATANSPKIPTVNKAGRDIYYPPGHEMMLTKREEMSGSSAGGGRWAKGSGMYEYESGSKSKMTTKSGGAVVPVCLPLCCAMPCSIM